MTILDQETIQAHMKAKREAIEPLELDSIDQFVAMAAHYGMTMYQNLDILTEKTSMSPKLKREISKGEFAIGDVTCNLSIRSNIIMYSMVFLLMKLAESGSTPKEIYTTMSETFHNAGTLLAQFYHINDGPTGITPEAFFDVLAEGENEKPRV